MKPHILVTGAHGQLGSELQKLAPSTPAFFYFTDADTLDICSTEAIEAFMMHNHITHIINCAAYTAVDKAESEPGAARAVNALAAGTLALAAKHKGVFLIHISTDYVFDGHQYRPYTETDATAPLSVYGKTKLEGEERVISAGAASMIIRTSWLYSSFGNNFVKTMLRLAREKDRLNVISDQVGTPTYARDLATAILEIIAINRLPQTTAIYHYSNHGVASWYDFAHEIFRIKGILTPLHPIPTSSYPTPAVRPQYSLLDKSKITGDFGIHIPHWADSLEQCLSLIHEKD